MVECLLQLQATQVNHTMRKIEELSGKEQQSQITEQEYPKLNNLQNI